MSSAPLLVLSVQGMTCQHCVKAVTQSIQAQDDQAEVVVDLPAATVSVRSARLDRATVVHAVEAEGYTVRA